MSKKSYLRSYLKELISRGHSAMAHSIEKTAADFTAKNLDTFSFANHEIGLLFGNVQAGKTAQMFGIICAAADASFPIFILLTTDNVALQKQTYDRVVSYLSGSNFCICGETDKQKFIENALGKPTIIVLKKTSSVLLQWYNTLVASSFVKGNALFIVDDEADAASPNTLINSNRISTINHRLANIRNSSIGSIYLQVTGTPQSLLLQSTTSDFKPAFLCNFEPGNDYLGGNFFFSSYSNEHIRFIEDCGTGKTEDGLYNALIHHLIASAQLLLSGKETCNFVIHPGVRKASHITAQRTILKILEKMSIRLNEPEFIEELKDEYAQLSPQKTNKLSFPQIYSGIKNLIENNQIKILIMNGDTQVSDTEYTTGSNVIIGGNVLGRGVTFPKLQTLYYSRTATKPQSDTMWQHSRMFGYDRDPGLMKVFIAKELYKLFSDINAGNNSIIEQIEKGLKKVQIYYPVGINPTRKNVIDVGMVSIVTGGTNYYPNNPTNSDIDKITALLNRFDSSGYYQVSPKMILEILIHIIPSEDFNISAFENVIRAKLPENPSEQSILIVRRGRKVTQGTGSLLSPNDRTLGEQFNDKIVLTMYQIQGNHGWKQNPIWVPNIKLPDFINYFDVH